MLRFDIIVVRSSLLALGEIRRHLFRSFLTVLGIVIGVAAVIVTVTLGQGSASAVVRQISELGANLLIVEPGRSRAQDETDSPPLFKLADIEAIREQIGGPRAVAPQARTFGLAVRHGRNQAATIDGSTNDYFHSQNWRLSHGRFFTPEEETAGKSVCIVGATVARKLFGDEGTVGQSLKVRDLACEIVGQLAARGQGGFGEDRDSTIVMPLKAVQRRLTGSGGIHSIIVAVDPAYAMLDVKASLAALLRERRHLPAGKLDNFSILDTKQIVDATTKVTNTMTALLGAAAGISLLVGGIGIMNIMLVSVTERTREIGIRLAIGATARDVLLQFLVEATLLACLGSLIGILIALGLSIILMPMMNIPLAFDWSVNLGAFAFAAAIGIAFGYFPARRAARLNPIDALRHE